MEFVGDMGTIMTSGELAEAQCNHSLCPELRSRDMDGCKCDPVSPSLLPFKTFISSSLPFIPHAEKSDDEVVLSTSEGFRKTSSPWVGDGPRVDSNVLRKSRLSRILNCQNCGAPSHSFSCATCPRCALIIVHATLTSNFNSYKLPVRGAWFDLRVMSRTLLRIEPNLVLATGDTMCSSKCLERTERMQNELWMMNRPPNQVNILQLNFPE